MRMNYVELFGVSCYPEGVSEAYAPAAIEMPREPGRRKTVDAYARTAEDLGGGSCCGFGPRNENVGEIRLCTVTSKCQGRGDGCAWRPTSHRIQPCDHL